MRVVARWLPLAGAVAGSSLVLYLPGSDVPSSPAGSDKVVHVATFGVLALAGAWAGLRRLPLGIALVGYAALSEVLQAILPINRDGDWHDWLADSVGVLGSLAAVRVVNLRSLRRSGTDARQPGGQAMDVKATNRRVIEQFRVGGAIDGMSRDRLVLLTTIGRRTGERRTTPMMFQRDGDRLLVIASNVGAPKHPDWYQNLAADPRVTVEVGDEHYDALAAPAAGAERDRLWSMLKGKYPFFAEHEANTDRVIPVVLLTRV
ncbi:MAG: nitroreductase/quinone reductase family protein [Mycobacteriales bacterium]